MLPALFLPVAQDSYQPAQVGEGLWIVPVWSQPPDPTAVNIRLEPGARGCPGWPSAMRMHVLPEAPLGEGMQVRLVTG